MTHFVRSGLITALMETTPTGIAFVGPLAFDEETVAETGRWTFDGVDAEDGPAVADALSDVYVAEFDGWCARKAAALAALQDAPVARARIGVDGRMHMPCPALWAGR